MLAAFPICATENFFAGFFRITFTSHIPPSKECLMRGDVCSSSLHRAPRFEQVSEVHSTVRRRSIRSIESGAISSVANFNTVCHTRDSLPRHRQKSFGKSHRPGCHPTGIPRALPRNPHTLLDELAEATLDGTRKEHMEFLETVPLLIIDDPGMRNLPLTAAEELLEIIMRPMSRPAPY